MASPLPIPLSTSTDKSVSANPLLDATAWIETVLKNLEASCAEGQAAVNYIRAHRVKIGFRKQNATGAMWFIDGNIYLNANTYSIQTYPADAFMLNLIAHEALHLQQGFFTALSVYGELQAWQLGFRVAQSLGMILYHSALVKLMALPLDFDRDLLGKTRTLMQDYAGNGYRIDLLPFFPLPKEVSYGLTKQLPKQPR
jgi:hypothetical protein